MNRYYKVAEVTAEITKMIKETDHAIENIVKANRFKAIKEAMVCKCYYTEVLTAVKDKTGYIERWDLVQLMYEMLNNYIWEAPDETQEFKEAYNLLYDRLI